MPLVLYNFGIRLLQFIVVCTARLIKVPHTKIQRFIVGQAHVFESIGNADADVDADQDVFWIHAASYGEYNAVRPILQRLHEDGTYRLVLTFFSATGVDIVGHRHEVADAVYFLPLDTPGNVRRFLDLVKPARAAFVISEYWVNYLLELRHRGIPTYLVSAHITPKAPFLRWYGNIFRHALKAFDKIMVLDAQSVELLDDIGFSNVVLTGDPLFDNAATRAATPYHNAIIERFTEGQKVFVAGSVTEIHDLYLMAGLAYMNPTTKFLIVPHEITSGALRNIQRMLLGKARLYSECDETTDFTTTQALIIDFMGALVYLYRYGDMAYVGGGFTRTLHSVIEASVYGIPVAFGPKAKRQQTAFKLLEYGIGTQVKRVRDINKWYRYMQEHPNELAAVKQHAAAMMLHHKGASEYIANILLNHE